MVSLDEGRDQPAVLPRVARRPGPGPRLLRAASTTRRSGRTRSATCGTRRGSTTSGPDPRHTSSGSGATTRAHTHPVPTHSCARSTTPSTSPARSSTRRPMTPRCAAFPPVGGAYSDMVVSLEVSYAEPRGLAPRWATSLGFWSPTTSGPSQIINIARHREVPVPGRRRSAICPSSSRRAASRVLRDGGRGRDVPDPARIGPVADLPVQRLPILGRFPDTLAGLTLDDCRGEQGARCCTSTELDERARGSRRCGRCSIPTRQWGGGRAADRRLRAAIERMKAVMVDPMPAFVDGGMTFTVHALTAEGVIVWQPKSRATRR